MTVNLGAIGFQKYSDLFDQLGQRVAGFIVVDLHGKLVWASGRLNEDRAKLIRQALVDRKDKYTESCNFTINEDSVCSHVCSAPLISKSTELIGLIATILDDAPKSPETEVNLQGCLHRMAACILDEVQMASELDAMALELTDRYEELNLVYNSGDETSHFSEGQIILRQLVENCVDFINVDMAALIMPEKKITFLEYGAEISDGEVRHTLDELVASVINATREKNQTLVINSNSEFLALGYTSNLGYKLISSPVYDGNSEVCGCLVVLKSHNRKDFTNSDRNLMQVMARKAGKIIQATYDKLTGLLTRSSFESILDDLVSQDIPIMIDRCLMLLNIEQLSVINDMYGLKAGDALIRFLGSVLERELRNGDHVARLSGDEFGIFLNHCTATQAKAVGSKLQNIIRKELFVWKGKQIVFSVRVGIVPVSKSTTGRYLLTAADVVMGLAKHKGQSRIEVYQHGNEEVRTRKRHMIWVNKVQEALREDRFRLVCQGIFDTHNPTVVHHYEVLIRMLDSSGGIIAPFEFLPAAERYRLMPSIDQWVVTRVIELLTPYADQLETSGLSWAINLSGQSISDKEFCEFLVDTLSNSVIPTSCLSFEVTESSTIDSLNEAHLLIESVKSYGCSIYLDDFGTGLSSFSYMQMLPFDYIKIDGSFIKNVRTDPISNAMVKAICDVVSAMELKSVAEFVEYDEDVSILREMGVDFLQGYLLHKPEDMKQVLNEKFANQLLEQGTG